MTEFFKVARNIGSGSFRAASTLLIVVLLGLFSLSGSALAASTGMLSAMSSSQPVQEALLAKADPEMASAQPVMVASSRQSPSKVALISAVLPGYGQIYNHSAWKLPLYYGLLVHFASNAIDDGNKYDKYRKLYSADPSGPDAATNLSNRETFQKRSNNQYVWLVLTHLVGIADAYVDAHLFEFDKNTERGSGQVSANMDSTTLLSFTKKF
jgi:hypothetical protein